MRDEVEAVADTKYSGRTQVGLGKAFAYWAIDKISHSLRSDEVEAARSRFERKGGPGDFEGDGIWVHKGTLYVIQAKYSPPIIPKDDDSKFNPTPFGPEAAREIKGLFTRIRDEVVNTARPTDPKLVEGVSLYKDALANKLRVELVVAISGKARKSLVTEVKRINDMFNSDRRKYEKHNCSIYDHTRFNSLYNAIHAKAPSTVHLSTKQKFVIPAKGNNIYALAATVAAEDLIKIRQDNDVNIYHSNFRFLLKGSRGVAAPKILATLQSLTDRQDFWRYNNGVTVCCETLTPTGARGLDSDSWAIEGFQVVNGLQTIETLYSVKDKDWFDGVNLLVRVIPTRQEGEDQGTAMELEEHIAEYSNSQSPITPRDLRANDPVQVFIERECDDIYNIQYVRKAGEGPGVRQPKRVISNEVAAQAALSFWSGKSYEAKAQKKLIFEKAKSARPGFYEEIFVEGQTTAEYILLPALFLANQSEYVRKVKKKQVRGLYKALNLIALAVVGDGFKRITRIAASPSSAKVVKDELARDINRLQALGERKSDTFWKQVFANLAKVVQARRSRQARMEHVRIGQITPRNVILGMRYTDKGVKDEIWRRRNIKQVPNKLKDMLEP